MPKGFEAIHPEKSYDQQTVENLWIMWKKCPLESCGLCKLWIKLWISVDNHVDCGAEAEDNRFSATEKGKTA